MIIANKVGDDLTMEGRILYEDGDVFSPNRTGHECLFVSLSSHSLFLQKWENSIAIYYEYSVTVK